MFKKITSIFVHLVNKFLPDAFLFALILTFIVFVGGIAATAQSPAQMLNHWFNGFWSLLAFSMQMAMVAVSGTAMAQSPAIKKLLKSLALAAKTPVRAVFITAIVAACAAWINWGFGLVVGALIAREMAKNVEGCDYGLLVASGYAGFIVWHGGLSASIPLTLATGGEALASVTRGAVTAAIPTSQTIFSPLNLAISVVLIVGMPLIMVAMTPKPKDIIAVDPRLLEDVEIEDKKDLEPADKIERSKILWIATVAMGYAAIVLYFMRSGFDLNLNIVNFIFMFTGMLLHGSLKKYLDAVMEAARGAAGVLLQFPFYAGIMGMMTGVSSDGGSIAMLLSNLFVNVSTSVTFPLYTFLSAGIVNFFVPSGGGQWAVQAPVMMPAGKTLGVDPAITALAIAWGDAWTNMAQPFWALPALAIAKLSARNIMGYCVMVLLFSGVVICGGFLIYGLVAG